MIGFKALSSKLNINTEHPFIPTGITKHANYRSPMTPAIYT